MAQCWAGGLLSLRARTCSLFAPARPMASSAVTTLATELLSLASETRRKYPDVREASDKAVAIIRSNPEHAASILARDSHESEDILRPLFMGCATRVAKIVVLCLSSLHRLIAFKAIPASAIPNVVSTLSDCLSQGVDVQLRILQMLLSLLTNYPGTHGDLLGDALLLCFKLQESRIAVVSSTAAATLRQLVMLVFDKVVDHDRQVSSEPPVGELTISTTLPDGQTVSLLPTVKDAFSVFEDLCLLANLEHPRFLKLESLPKTFSLELIESVLTNYHELFRQRRELLLLLQHHLCPTLLKALSDKPVFPLTLRSIRVVFLLLKQFIGELATEAEVFLSLITRTISGDHENGEPQRPAWMRVLAMEIMRGLCSEVSIIRAMWDQYDSKGSGSTVFTSLVTALKRLAMEKPALLGVEPMMFGIGVTASGSDASYAYGIDVGAVVSGAANMVGMAGSGGGLSVFASSMKLQCIDQLDKADPPPIPETYVYLLALQCITSLSTALAALTVPIYTNISLQRPRSPGESTVRAPPALDMASLPPSDPQALQLKSAHGMIEAAWPATLAALSFFIATNLSEDLFADVLGSVQSMANAAGALGLATPRDAFLTCLSKFAIPPGVVSSLDSARARADPSTPRGVGGVLSAGVESLGLTALTGGGSSVPPSLSERNIACLKVLLGSVMFLAGSLGASWFSILETLQNAEYVLFGASKASATASARRVSVGPAAMKKTLSSSGNQAAGGGPAGARPPIMQDLDPINDVQAQVNRLFDASKNLDDDAFQMFVAALCKLSSEMVGMQAANRGIAEIDHTGSTDDVNSAALLSPTLSSSSLSGTDAMQRRRASGIQLAKSPPRSGDYAISKLGSVSRLNMHRLIYRDPSLAWEPITGHLLSVIRNSLAPGSIRLQAAEVLDGILVVAPKNINSTGELQAKIQLRILEVLSQQVIFEVNSTAGTVATDIRKLGLETLHDILQISAHSFVVGWPLVFEMMSSVCQAPRQPSAPSDSDITPSSSPMKRRPPPLKPFMGEKSNILLTRVAFKSLTLVCDAINTLPPEDLRLCIATIALFGQQSDTNMSLTAAESLLWSVSDSIQTKRRDAAQESTYSELWMFLLKELGTLCRDERPDVRNGAIQTLFRSLQLYGATLTPEMWTESMEEIILPLLDSTSQSLTQASAPPVVDDAGAPIPLNFNWDSSKSLIFQLIGSLFSAFLVAKIMSLPSFESFWDRWAAHVVQAAITDPKTVTTSGLHSFEATLSATRQLGTSKPDLVHTTWERCWAAVDAIGTAINDQHPPVPGATSTPAFSQESLLAFTHVIQTLYSLYGSTWDLERLRRLLQILKGVITYSRSADYRPDIDALSPVQAAVFDTVEGLPIKEVIGLSSLVLTDLADYATLAYYAAFSVEVPPISAKTASPPKHVTYIGLSKKAMPQVVAHCDSFKDNIAVYADGTMEQVLGAFAIPMKLRYDCPPASKFGSDPPLWKTATNSFLSILTNATPSLLKFGEELNSERIEGFWKRAVDGIRGALLADCSSMDRLPLAEQDAEEQFDRRMLEAIDKIVVPNLGDSRVSDGITISLAKALAMASKLHELDDSIPLPVPTTPQDLNSKSPSRHHKFDSLNTIEGTTAPVRVLPRERFAYWCFDLLFAVVALDSSENSSTDAKRVASLALPPLLNRCHNVFTSYIVDEALRGNIPFPRIREEELLYCLQKLADLRTWSGCLWAALSDDPTAASRSLPVIDPSLPPHELITDATRRSPKAHLFHFYTLLYEIATVPRASPSAWVLPSSSSSVSSMSFSRPLTPPASLKSKAISTSAPAGNGDKISASLDAVEVDARQLAKLCLREIGMEIGAEV
ncbi:hypothetical protein DL93DRAFT_1519713 [Clavulina sp. PMI_390]|nr:hypothetical protein DL93DRAFT_1519713 [Clavulina sp. PMI_390]